MENEMESTILGLGSLSIVRYGTSDKQVPLAHSARNARMAPLEGATQNPNYCLNSQSLRVQAPNNHILAQNLYYNYYYLKPKYLNIGYMDPLGMCFLTLHSPLSS